MKLKTIWLSGITALLLASGLSACDKDDPAGPSARDVKYELTGNFTGHIFLVTSDNVNGNETYTITSLPWSKDKTYAPNVLAIGTGGNSVVANPGVPGQTVTLKIYSGGTVVKSGSVTADVNGIVSLPSLAHTF